MLVLSRKQDETIRIGNDIEVTVVSISGDTVRLGIKAPRSVTILRSEVYAEIQRQNRAAVLPEDIPEQLQDLLKSQNNKPKD